MENNLGFVVGDGDRVKGSNFSDEVINWEGYEDMADTLTSIPHDKIDYTEVGTFDEYEELSSESLGGYNLKSETPNILTLDMNKINTVEDIKQVLDFMGFRFYDGELLNPIRHLLKEVVN